MEILDHLLEQEVKNLKSRKVEMRLNYSGLPFWKTMNDFDFTFQPSIGRSVIDDLMTLSFIHNKQNVVFLGPPVVGKTHLSVALEMNAANSEISIYYTTAVNLVQILKKDFLSSRLSYRLATYSRFLSDISVLEFIPAIFTVSKLILFLYVSIFIQFCCIYGMFMYIQTYQDSNHLRVVSESLESEITRQTSIHPCLRVLCRDEGQPIY